jgi:hypothetical protein
VIVADCPVATNDGGLEVNVIFTGSSHELQPLPFAQIKGCHPVVPAPDVRSPLHVTAKQTLENTSAVNEITIAGSIRLANIFTIPLNEYTIELW